MRFFPLKTMSNYKMVAFRRQDIIRHSCPLLLPKYSTLSRYYLDNKRQGNYISLLPPRLHAHTHAHPQRSCCHSIHGVGTVPFSPQGCLCSSSSFSPPGCTLITLLRGPSTTKPECKRIHLEKARKRCQISASCCGQPGLPGG